MMYMYKVYICILVWGISIMASIAMKAFWARTFRSKKKRCDSQSICAHRARMLLGELSKLMIEAIEPPSWIYFSDNVAYEWARGQYYRLPESTRDFIVGTALHTEDSPMLLSELRCSVVGLETIREAMLQVSKHELYFESFYAHMLLGYTQSTTLRQVDKDEFLLFWLYVLEIYFSNPPFLSSLVLMETTTSEELQWILPKHMGRGVESLKALYHRHPTTTTTGYPTAAAAASSRIKSMMGSISMGV